MIIFGGKNDENEKLNDVWIFNLTECTWSKIDYSSEDLIPIPRSGHSAVVYNNKMMIFAGIFEITRELNDSYLFDIATQKWSLFFSDKESEEASPTRNIYYGTS